MDDSNMKSVSVCLTQKQLDFLDEMCEVEGMSRSEYIRELVRKHMRTWDTWFGRWVRRRVIEHVRRNEVCDGSER